MESPIELESAIKKLQDNTKPQTKTQALPLESAQNYHIAQDLYAPIDVPSFDRSAVDGYAIRSDQTINVPKKLNVEAQIMAGDNYTEPIDTTQTVRIMTGAQIPLGFDAVIRQEHTDQNDNQVEIYQTMSPWENYRKKGEDIKKGSLVIKRYTKLTAIHIGILASMGINKIEVLQPLKAGVISSGTELADIEAPLAPGQIYCSNRYMIQARLKDLNTDVVVSKQNRDNIQEFCRLIEQSVSKVDILITTGAVSVGKKDIMQDVMKELGATKLFWKIDMRPGTPVMASVYKGTLILSLSGNPVAALTTFELLFRPMLASFLQDPSYICEPKKAILTDDFKKESKQRRFVRAYTKDGRVSLGNGDFSSILSTMLDCNCFIDIKADTPKIKSGQEVDIVLL